MTITHAAGSIYSISSTNCAIWIVGRTLLAFKDTTGALFTDSVFKSTRWADTRQCISITTTLNTVRWRLLASCAFKVTLTALRIDRIIEKPSLTNAIWFSYAILSTNYTVKFRPNTFRAFITALWAYRITSVNYGSDWAAAFVGNFIQYTISGTWVALLRTIKACFTLTRTFIT